MQQKSSWLAKVLAPWKDRIDKINAPSEGERLGYRTKVCLATVFTGEAWVAGVRRREEIIAIPECPVHHPGLNSTLAALLRILPSPDTWPMAYIALYGKQLSIVLKTKQMPGTAWLEDFLDIASTRPPGFLPEGIWVHLHPSAGHRIFLKHEWKLIWGSDSSVDRYGLRYGPVTFSQVFPGLHEQAVGQAVSFLSPGPSSFVVDLYCGNGGSLRKWAEAGAAAAGVELNGESVSHAQTNAPGCVVFRGKCSERIPQLKQSLEAADKPVKLVYVNPPRTGLEEEVCRWLAWDYMPERMAYLSCSPGTLKRDLEMMVAGGYRVEKLLPFDFFPQTHHIEVLALLTGKK